MAEIKTKPTAQPVTDFLDKTVTDKKVRADCATLIKLMKKITGSPAKMWGPSIIGFGKYHYKYESGHEGDMCITGFSPRKPNLTLYVMVGTAESAPYLKNLGKYKASKACLYIKRLEDVDMKVLEDLIRFSVDDVKKKYPTK